MYTSAGNNAVSVKLRLFDPAGPISLQILHEKVFHAHDTTQSSMFCFPSLEVV